MNGATIVTQKTLGTNLADWKVVGSEDFDGDGRAELLWHNTTTNTVEIDSLGAGGFSYVGTPGYLDSTWSVADIGDYNGDGKADILWKTSSNFYVEWVMNGAAVTSQKTLGTIPANWRLEGSGDYAGIGMDYLAWRDTNNLTFEIDSLSDAGLSKVSSFNLGSSGWTLVAGN